MRKVEILISIQTNSHYALASKEMSEKLSFTETTHKQEFTGMHFNKISIKFSYKTVSCIINLNETHSRKEL